MSSCLCGKSEGDLPCRPQQAGSFTIRIGVVTLPLMPVASEPDPEQSLFVPVILTSAGRNNSFFTSKLTLTNRGNQQAILRYTYTARVGGGKRDGHRQAGPRATEDRGRWQRGFSAENRERDARCPPLDSGEWDSRQNDSRIRSGEEDLGQQPVFHLRGDQRRRPARRTEWGRSFPAQPGVASRQCGSGAGALTLRTNGVVFSRGSGYGENSEKQSRSFHTES